MTSPSIHSLRIAFIGGGNMGRALIGGLLERGANSALLSVGEAWDGARDALSRDFGIAVHAQNLPAVAGADVIVVAVKPQDVGPALVALQSTLIARSPLVISVAAGIRVRDLQTWCGPKTPVVRAMPNRPALVGAGATGLFASDTVGEIHRNTAQSILQACGTVVWVPTEEALDVVTALSGSGPAYFFLLTELITQAAIDLGLEPATARTLALETLKGSGQLAQAGNASGAHADDPQLFARLRAEVTSKGGTTEAAVRVFEAAGLRDIVAHAMAAATQRGREMAEQFSNPR